MLCKLFWFGKSWQIYIFHHGTQFLKQFRPILHLLFFRFEKVSFHKVVTCWQFRCPSSQAQILHRFIDFKNSNWYFKHSSYGSILKNIFDLIKFNRFFMVSIKNESILKNFGFRNITLQLFNLYNGFSLYCICLYRLQRL